MPRPVRSRSVGAAWRYDAGLTPTQKLTLTLSLTLTLTFTLTPTPSSTPTPTLTPTRYDAGPAPSPVLLHKAHKEFLAMQQARYLVITPRRTARHAAGAAATTAPSPSPSP